jgi:hypothetical protein
MDPVIKPRVASFRDCRERCDQIVPGVCEDDSDYSLKKTTKSELRVEQYLKSCDLRGKSLLHIGVGNSQLAACFAPMLSRIDGVTIMPNEKQRAEDLNIANYQVLLSNKYAPDLAWRLTAKYDFIVDVNLASFCCCQFHFDAMMESYTRLLNAAGLILTDLEGMLWIQKGVDRRWLLDFADLQWIGGHYGLTAIALDDMIFGLQKPATASGQSVLK